MTPYRTLPVFAEKPICAGFPREFAQPEYQDPITGELHAARYDKVYCKDKNAKGLCKKFEPKPVLGFWRSLVAKLSAWLGP